MEMENHTPPPPPPQYNISDLRHFITTTGHAGPHHHFPSFIGGQPSSLSDLMTAHNHHRNTTPASAAAVPPHPTHHHYNNNNNNNSSGNDNEMVVMGRHLGGTAAADAVAISGTGVGVVDMLHHHHYQDHFSCDATGAAAAAANFDGGDGSAARWPRQETLTLLEIRSRLDHKFKEANQKGPLWDEVARIMCEEHGYQRSGKKCREKFENLYKYYKKTKEGKAGRQDGKHYRFFRQLEALYGGDHHPTSLTSETQITENTPQFHALPTQPPQQTANLVVPPHAPRGCDTSVSLSNSFDFETSSTDNEELNGSMESNGSMETNNNKKKKKRGYGSSGNWKAKIKEFIDEQMKKIMEKQETWLDKMMNTLESRERERMVREEEWRKQEADRVEREQKFWASERAWIEARDSALMSALDKLTASSSNINNNNNNFNGGQHQWPEHEVTRLIQVRTSMESRFQQCGFSEEVLWEDIATKMAYLGYDRSAMVCKQKWDSINDYFRGSKRPLIKDESKKKRKENYNEIHPQNHHHHHHHNNNNSNNNHNEGGGGGIYMNQLSGFNDNNNNSNNNNCEINEPRLQLNEGSSSPSSHNSNVNNANNNNVNVNVNGVGNVMNDSCLRFFLGDHGETNLGWESNYGLKLNNADNHCA